VFGQALPSAQVEALLRKTGREVARDLSRGMRNSGGLKARVARASEMINEHLGATTRVESNGRIVIRGAGCPLAALTGNNRSVCLAMESLVSEIVGVPARECCDRAERPRCCFEIRRAPGRRRA
jgi:predicted ArsR family transcriptional regulator